MSKAAFILDEQIDIVAPVHIKVPQSAKTGGGKSNQSFVTRTAYVTIRIPTEDELEEVGERVRKDNADWLKRLNEAGDRLTAATDDQERADAEAAQAKLRTEYRDNQVELLKEFVIGLPDGHGIQERDGSSAEYSANLIERLCGYRNVRRALWEAFMLLLNGEETKKGNS